ncbi:MAG: metalloregulator ArsR/SmtB family transcription factor [Verrucomicrobiales bacterium]|nr:metalloregulator ArsR/SmtB family transcription factor [Verrucomicrobiales bacterium]
MADEQKMDREGLERVARVFQAFSDATRLAILQELKSGPCGVGTLVERVGGSQGNISKQLQVLAETGFIRREKKGNQVFYSIDDPRVFEMCNVVCSKLTSEAQEKAGFVFEI